MSNTLEALKKITTVVADTGDFETLEAYAPQDATTNPSLILKALQKDAYAPVLDDAIAATAESGTSGEARIDLVIDHMLVGFGQKILEIVPGRVSTEVDAILIRIRSFGVPLDSYSAINSRALATVASTSKESRASTSVETRPGTISRIFCPKPTSM